MTALALYLVAGLIQTFAIWVASDDKPTLTGVIFVICFWPVLLIVVMATPGKIAVIKRTKILFIKVWLATAALSIIVYFIADRIL